MNIDMVLVLLVLCCLIIHVCEAGRPERGKKTRREQVEGMHHHLIICCVQEVIPPAVRPYFHVNAYTHVQSYAYTYIYTVIPHFLDLTLSRTTAVCPNEFRIIP